ncbi:ESX secretion-associated protein EspG [Streptoalloteichus hindustanus]|uniref:EspG family protein n=1 Tax=Streptoalloteichus hindustanus TaxID=2017 RepID=A0A1M5PZG6_STRHI|nr:ESX secretion-associated protein EspG [Streptoalloteichus hindustanus]SHH07407.1 EspG family protein [Streptoalloteichus hindustanus]
MGLTVPTISHHVPMVSATAYQVAWQDLGLPPMPTVLHVAPRGYPEVERQRVLTEAYDEMRAAGLFDGRGYDLDFVAAMAVLARPRRSVDARLWLGAEVRALAAASTGRAVLAVLVSDHVRVHPVDPANLAVSVVRLLPPRPAGPGRSVSLPADVLEEAAAQAGASVASLRTALCDLGAHPADAHHIARMSADACHGGQFGATVVDGLGRWGRADHVVGFHDTPAGRYLMERHRAVDGRWWITIAPADANRLVGQVERLLNGIG